MRTQLTSLTYLHNWGTRLVYFIALPLIDLCLLLLIARQYQAGISAVVAVAAIGMGDFSLTMGTLAQLLVTDNDLGVDRLMAANRPLSWHYWGSKAVVSLGVGWLALVSNLFLLGLLGLPARLLGHLLILSPLIGLSGLIVGFTSFVAVWTAQNPYLIVNWISAALPVLAGTTVALSAYPTWLRWLSDTLPLAHTLNSLRTGRGWTGDLLIDGGWLLAGCLLYTWQVRHLAQHQQHSW